MKKIFWVLLILTWLLSACSSGQPAPQATSPAAAVSQAPKAAARTLKVMTHDSFAVSEKVITAFETQNQVRVEFLKSGDAGSAVNKAVLAKDKPLADVFYGVDNTFLSRALDEGIFEPYASPLLANIPAAFQLDPSRAALPVDYGDVCLNYDKEFLAAKNLAAPRSLEDLLKPEYKGLLVVENPATSSPGLAFLLATIGHFGEDHYLDYWQGLVDNGLLVVNDWETAYNQQFTRGGGDRPLVVSYASSPPFEVIYASQPITTPATAAMVTPGSCFRQIEFVGILKGTPNLDLAQKWVDFMLSTTFQEDVPLQMFVFPVNPAARLDQSFTQYLQNPEKTAEVNPADIIARREKWLQDWRQVVLQ